MKLPTVDPVPSWKSFLAIGIISLVFSLFLRESLSDRSLIYHFFHLLGWGSILFGISWWLRQNNVRFLGVILYPYLLFALLALLLFSYFPEVSPFVYWTGWLLASLTTTILYKLREIRFQWRKATANFYREIALLVSANLLIGCWFQSYHIFQSWLDEYPALANISLSHSAFVIPVGDEEIPSLAATIILGRLEAIAQEKANGKPWSQVESWVLQVRTEKNQLKQDSQLEIMIPNLRIRQYWLPQISAQKNENGYPIKLQATWQGPNATGEGYAWYKSCTIEPISPNPPNDQVENTGQLRCDREIQYESLASN
ncbi:DUF5357 family protein [Geitlerinema sp. PCC 9228]|uniref:DUF5357 family protein n=1 Tax=Geitlerinema sp. PCC 9228 TaxID=111611 RepID=UPI0008F9A963|nr:DUF5357 family protein [Geitlerinema sp. PCC 9228]